MKFDIVVGNNIGIFDSKEQHKHFMLSMGYMGKHVFMLKPEEWVRLSKDMDAVSCDIEIKYARVYSNRYFIEQIEDLTDIESEDKGMDDNKELLVLLSKQILLLSEKIEELSDRVSSMEDRVYCMEDSIDSIVIDIEEIIEENK